MSDRARGSVVSSEETERFGTSASPARRWPRGVWILTGAAFGVRAAALAASAGIPCLQDECSYIALANALASGRGFLPHSGHYWPPGYIVFLAAHRVLFGTPVAAKLTQVILSAALVPLVYALGVVACGSTAAAGSSGQGSRARFPGKRTDPSFVGMMAAALVAFDPTLVAYSHYIFSETLFLPLFTGALLAILISVETASIGAAAAGGALLGASCLVKVVPLYFAPVLAAALWLRGRPEAPSRRRMLAAGALLAATAAVVAPWTVRNAIAHHRFVAVETTAGKNLVRGNSDWPPTNWDWGCRRVTPALDEAGCTQENLVDRDACFRRHGIDAIVSHPVRFVAQAPTKLADLANPTSYLVRDLRLSVYGDLPGPLVDSLVTAAALFAVVFMMGGAVGWILAAPSPARWIAASAVLYTLVVHLATFGMSRFRLPLVPLLAMGTALALAGARDPAPRRPRLRAALLTAVLVALAACWSVRVAGLYHRALPEDLPPALGGQAAPEG